MAKSKKKGHFHLDLDGDEVIISIEGDNIYLAAALATAMDDKKGSDVHDVITLAVSAYMGVNKKKKEK